MITTENLTSQEREVLKDHYRHCQTALIRERAHAILLSDQRHSIPEIARMLFRDADTVYGWIKSFNEIRIASIFPGYRDNHNASKLTKEQKEEVKRTLSKPNGLTTSFWTLPKFKEYVAAHFNIVYESDRSYHYLLAYCGYSFKLPNPFDKRRNEAKAQKRLNNIHQELRKYWANRAWAILASDEAIISWETEIRRCWMKKGEKTILKVNREKINQSYFGALNLKNGKTHLVRLGWQNQAEIIKALERVCEMYPDHRICILWDNARWHKGKELRVMLGKGKPLERIHLINFPPYCPDLNPQEHVWKFGKDSIGNSAPEAFETLLASFERSISKKIFNYQLPKFVLR